MTAAPIRIRFDHANLLDPRAGCIRENVCVLVEGDTVREVSGQGQAPAADQVIDARGFTLAPGWIDCHVHVIASSYNFAQTARSTNLFAALRAMPIMKGMLMRGFTTVRDAGGADGSFDTAVAEGMMVGPRIFASGKALSQTGGHGDGRGRTDVIEPCACSSKVGVLARVVDGTDAVRLAVREEILRGASQIKIMASGGVSSPSDPIHFLGYSREEITTIVEEASNSDTYVLAHAYTGKAIARAVECGVRSIEHGNLVTPEAAQIMARHGAFAVPTVITYEALASEGAALGLPAESVAKIETARAGAMRSLEIFREAGVTMAFGSDLLGESHRLQAEEFRLRAEVLGNLEAIRAATIHAAALLRREGILGEIVPGARADILLIDGNPLTDINCLLGQGERLRLIMQGGQVVKPLH
jgi:imidazolonepropionase-like amidohydrolase